jgi:thiol-disulfide isomerase/thioredoxin
VKGQLFVLLLARLPLVMVFGAAGALKYRDQSTFSETLLDFGAPGFLAKPLTRVLPGLEIATALLLLVGDPFRAGSIAALLLLLVFTLAVTINLIRGKRPNCRCFGQVSSKPIGWTTIARNLVLSALAVACFLLQTKRWAALDWQITPFAAVAAAVTFAVIAALVAEGWTIILLLKQQGRLLTRVEQLEAGANQEKALLLDEFANTSNHGLAVGSKAPDFLLQTVTGGVASLESLCANGLPVLMIFANPHCDACNKLLPSIAYWQSQLEKEVTIAIISEDRADRNLEKFAPYGLHHILLQKRRQVAADFLVELTPSALVIGPGGDIRSLIYAGPQAIEGLMKQAMASSRLGKSGQSVWGGRRSAAVSLRPQKSASMIEPGNSAPVPPLRDLDGRLIDISSIQTETMILFWNANCSFCRSMLPELKAWEINQQKRLDLVVIASGTEQANRELGLHSSVVLDPAASLMQRLGVPGTPSAFLVSAGKVASTVQVGSSAIWALVGTSEPRAESDRQAEKVTV